MAIEALQSFNPFIQQTAGFIPGKVQTPKVAQPQQQPKIGEQEGLAGFELPETINRNPQLSFLRGEALTNMALGEADAINVKGGKAGGQLNVIT